MKDESIAEYFGGRMYCRILWTCIKRKLVLKTNFLSYLRVAVLHRFYCISKRAVQTALEKLLDPRRSIASQRGSVPEFLRKPITNCDFPWGGV